MYLPFGKYGSLHFEDIIDMALSEDICPNLSTIQVYFGDFDQNRDFLPNDLFVENPEEISEILPKRCYFRQLFISCENKYHTFRQWIGDSTIISLRF